MRRQAEKQMKILFKQQQSEWKLSLETLKSEIKSKDFIIILHLFVSK